MPDQVLLGVPTHFKMKLVKLFKSWLCNTPVEVVHYGVKNVNPANIDLKLKYDFNFLTVAQMGPRKNLAPMIKWFAEEFHNEEVGFVVKANIANNSQIDRVKLRNSIESVLKPLGKTESVRCI